MLNLLLSSPVFAALASRWRPSHIQGPCVRFRLLCDDDLTLVEAAARDALAGAGVHRFSTRSVGRSLEVRVPQGARHVEGRLAGLPGVAAVQWAEVERAAA